MRVRTALALINQTLDEVLAEQEGDFDADTGWAVAWFDQFGFNDGPFGDAETLCKAKNTAIRRLAGGGYCRSQGWQGASATGRRVASGLGPAGGPAPDGWGERASPHPHPERG